MPFGIQINPITGRPICPCCKLNLHNCRRCWYKHHNGELHDDFIPPEFYGEVLISEEIMKKVYRDLNKEYNPEIKLDKKRKYKEGDYFH